MSEKINLGNNPSHGSRPTRILVVMLHRDEPTVHMALGSIWEQTGVSITIYMISGLPEWEAHQAFVDVTRREGRFFDLIIKFDPDMRLQSKRLLAEIALTFAEFSSLGAIVLPLHDSFFGKSIYGVWAFRGGARIRSTRDRVRADRFRLASWGLQFATICSDVSVPITHLEGASEHQKVSALVRRLRKVLISPLGGHVYSNLFDSGEGYSEESRSAAARILQCVHPFLQDVMDSPEEAAIKIQPLLHASGNRDAMETSLSSVWSNPIVVEAREHLQTQARSPWSTRASGRIRTGLAALVRPPWKQETNHEGHEVCEFLNHRIESVDWFKNRSENRE